MDIPPTDHRLRRLHRIDAAVLEEKKQLLAQGKGVDPVSIVRFKRPNGFEVYIVADGTHRVQAALEMGLETIEFEWGDLKSVEREARRRGRNFDDLAHRARKFAGDDHE
ncbi:hypothetical protein [Nannocystis punicea]|uniref:ParB/Sulfiredoxin domain-containing protein n=1 Tax=Nannocystis punicea TaxID=2995304 RepID=A0ABY7GVB0_9BACT|nr:hypothetical protein [Nannocystis poenicansa]WAS90891.1 hypothetical protein O0S08_32280 [Nannocystis poenicansa]